jgi:glycosyltransferase involved in cell wall biosynthesis
MASEVFFTVFTPTFNRAQSLRRVYESLLQQTFQDFEWLVVDDGSTDQTRELVETWQNDSGKHFPIRYVWQENQHKKAAHNRAVQEARGELLIVLDSDDRCVPDALEKLEMYWQSIPDVEKGGFSGVCGLCKYENGDLVGDEFPGGEYIDSDSLEVQYRYRVRGEKWGTMRTDVLRLYPFRTDIPGLVPEGTVWSQIARSYKTRFFNETLRIYCQDQEGLIARQGEVADASKNAVGAAYAKEQVLSCNLRYFRYRPVWFLLEAARMVRFYLHTDRPHRRLIRFWPSSLFGKILVIVAAPLGVGMFGWDRLRWRMHNAEAGRS